MATVLRGGRWGNIPTRGGGRNRRGRAGPPLRRHHVTQEQSVVCFAQTKQNMGISVFDMHSGEISVSEVQINDNFSCVSTVKKACSPCIVVAPLSLTRNDMFMKGIDPCIFREGSKSGSLWSSADGEEVEGEDPENNQQDNSTSVENTNENVITIPNSDVAHYKAVQMISMISVLAMPPSMTSEDRWAYLHHVFDGCDSAIRATGGLISFLLDNNVLLAQGENQELVCISSVRYRAITGGMEISSTTLQALQVFQVDSHPAGRGTGRGKEGLSLYGILRNNLKSSPGGRTLRAWMKCPLVDVNEIVERQTIVAAFRNTANHSFTFNIQDSLRGVRNVPGILNRIRTVTASVADWYGLLSSAKSFINVIDTFQSAARADADVLNTDLYARIHVIDVDELRAIITWIEGIVDFEESKNSNRMCVVQGFSADIDELRRCYSGLDDFLTGIGIKEMERIMNNPSGVQLSALLMTYQPQIGYLVLLEHRDVERIGLVRLKEAGFEYMFSSPSQGTYFKNQQCQTLDEDLGDIHGAIADLESKAIRYLETKIFPLARTAYNASLVVSELDCLQAMAATADEYQWNRPVIDTNAEGVKIENGRHVLLELNSPSFVSNSTHLRCGDVHVITGANSSGKSVYLKQVALMVILAQIGSCIPAESAEIRPVRIVQTRVTSFESISLGHSTFFMDAAQIAGMLEPHQRKPSLLLIDEFGKGTSEIDGIALLAATLNSVLNSDASSCMCLCATHYIEVLARGVLPMDNPRLATFSMEMLALDNVSVMPPNFKALKTKHDSTSRSHGAASSGTTGTKPSSSSKASSWLPELSYVRTYRLLRGTICSDSRALQCAMEQGIDRDILSRAAEVKADMSIDNPQLVRIPILNTRLRLCVQDAQDFLQMDLSG